MDKYRKNMLIEFNGVPCRIIDVQSDEYLNEEYYGLYLQRVKDNSKLVVIVDNKSEDTINILEA
jgi:Txe/YoeB family toxin of Txe-Axe toxin-antitoxin module